MKIKPTIHPVVLRLAAGLVYLVVRALHATLKVEVVGLEKATSRIEEGRPVIGVAWHGTILSFVLARLSLSIPRVMTMVSLSKDGEIAVRLAGQFGVDFARGSSSKGGAAAALQISRELAEPNPDGTGRLAVHFVDGPRGPRHKVKPGIVKIARLSGATVIPVEVFASRARHARSWDRHQLPLPFCRLVLVLGDPLEFSRASQEPGAIECDFEKDLSRIEQGLIALTTHHAILDAQTGLHPDRASE